MTSLRILIAEDNVDIAENIGDFLTMKGHQVDYAYDGKMAVSLAETESFDAIIMDIMMPKLNGLAATEQIRQQANGDVPILMLTAKDTVPERIQGLEAGADDYIVKPFDIGELYARIEAQARKALKQYHHILTVENLSLNNKQQTGSVGDVTLPLNPTTFKILWQLASEYPSLASKQDIEFSLWGDNQPEKDILRSHIYNLRKSLSSVTEHITVLGKHGKGYQLDIKRGS